MITTIIEKSTSPRRNERPSPPSSDLNPSPFLSDHPSSLILCDQTQRIRGRERDKSTNQRTIIPHVISSSFDPIPSINTTHPSVSSTLKRTTRSRRKHFAD